MSAFQKLLNFFVPNLYGFYCYRICRTFEDICNRVSELPEKTAELVELTHFMIQSRDVTVFDLNVQILGIAENLLFIIDRTILPSEYIRNVMLMTVACL